MEKNQSTLKNRQWLTPSEKLYWLNQQVNFSVHVNCLFFDTVWIQVFSNQSDYNLGGKIDNLDHTNDREASK